mgnify:CR=1 FL=1
MIVSIHDLKVKIYEDFLIIKLMLLFFQPLGLCKLICKNL